MTKTIKWYRESLDQIKIKTIYNTPHLLSYEISNGYNKQWYIQPKSKEVWELLGEGSYDFGSLVNVDGIFVYDKLDYLNSGFEDMQRQIYNEVGE